MTRAVSVDFKARSILLAQEALIEQANSTLAVVQNTTIPAMVDQLTAFTNIWAIVHGDIEQSVRFLNDSIAEQNFPIVSGVHLVLNSRNF